MLSLVIEAGGGTRQALVLDPQWVKIWKTIETTIFCCRPSLSLSPFLLPIRSAQRRVKQHSKIQRAQRGQEKTQKGKERKGMKRKEIKYENSYL